MTSRWSAIWIASAALFAAVCVVSAHYVEAAVAVDDGDVALPANWRTTATAQDRARLRGWYGAWKDALADARAKGFGAQIDSAGLLLDPQAALPNPDLPSGDYRCRTIKLGAKSNKPALIASDWHLCRIGGAQGIVTMIKTHGAQRLHGRLFPDDALRQIFLGTLLLGEETMALEYGSDKLRDMAGIVERIGDRRWRMVLPRPAFESLLDVIEIIPAE